MTASKGREAKTGSGYFAKSGGWIEGGASKDGESLLFKFVKEMARQRRINRHMGPRDFAGQVLARADLADAFPSVRAGAWNEDEWESARCSTSSEQAIKDGGLGHEGCATIRARMAQRVEQETAFDV